MTRVVASRRPTFGRSAGLAVALLHLGRAKLAMRKYGEAQTILGESYSMGGKYLSPSAVPALVAGMNLIEAQTEGGKFGRREGKRLRR